MEFNHASAGELPPQFFLTGTDTGVGKTVAAAVLCKCLDMAYWKPIQAGLEEETDSQCVGRLAGVKVYPERFRLKRPASPHVAAWEEGIEIDISDFHLPPAERLLVEGAGGLCVPVRRSPLLWQADLIRSLGLPAVVVARSGLGTLNHTFLTLHRLAEEQIACAGVVLVGPPHPENPEDIATFGGVPIICHLPWLDDLSGEFTDLVSVAQTQIMALQEQH